ncbi:hypothetical protein pmac_cds_631 [Pandoravirus macleodensis]|uniref:Uncharacterized protein n=1 Tax=Pandoravirus macleodensis TaxID=2107707 RepID=A0A2U7UFQ2_9VIRU|nr:hypothetical protein pmac_cds_631 [Pandoravirus macleodensis]AVK77319.1 hypothetical protein pmac_cds_631 [Pandoravirus macleodensis]UMO80069.1 hypothetical protein [Pandoravirus aubagnensis]
MGGGEWNTHDEDRVEVLAAALVDAVCDGDGEDGTVQKPSFTPLYDMVYAAVRRATNRRAYAQNLWESVADGLAHAAPDKGPKQSRLARMLADILAPVRHALDLCPEAFATLLVTRR